MALDRFLLASLRYLSNEEADHNRTSIVDALIAHPDTSRFRRDYPQDVTFANVFVT